MLALYDDTGWSGAVWLLAIATLAPLPLMFMFEETASADAQRGQAVRAGSMWLALIAFFRHPGNLQWAGLILLMTMAGITGPSLLVLILVDNGWSLARVGVVTSVIGPLIAAVLSLAAGYVFERTTRRRAIVTMILLGALFSYAKVPIVSNGYPETLTIVIIVLAVVVASLTNLAQKIVVIDKAAASPDFGTNYAVQHGLNQMAVNLAAVAAPMLAAVVGYVDVILMAGTLGLVTALLLARYRYL